jgi:three-Cys-motif partner protein
MPRHLQPWALEKFRLLELYLPRYLQANSEAAERIYIDGFAGPGTKQVIGTDEVSAGTPLLALDARATGSSDDAPGATGSSDAPGATGGFTRLFFIEASKASAAELRSAIAERGGDERATVVVGDVNEELPRILAGVERSTPVFVTLNADVVEPAWSTVEGMASWEVELLVSFPLRTAANRGAERAQMARYFGESGWEEDWAHGNYEAVREFYQDRLRSLGLRRQVDDELLVQDHDPSGHKDYWLIHAARREAEQGVWQWVLRRAPSPPSGVG